MPTLDKENTSLPTSNPQDQILMAITEASQLFLQGSLETWQQNVEQVLNQIGQQLHLKRIFMCKHSQVTADTVVTNLRYEWRINSTSMSVDVPGMQHISLQESGFSRWAGILYHQSILHAKIGELPITERGWFVSPEVERLIVVPVFTEDQWWGFIGFEDYAPGTTCSVAELDAFKTLGIVFGAAIHRKHMEESVRRQQASVEQKAREIADIAKFPDQDPSAVMRVAVGGVVLYANQPASSLIETLGSGVGKMVPDNWQGILEQSIADKTSMEMDISVDDRVIAIRLVPIPENHYVNIYSRDVTLERQVDQMKSDFISMASHQLRTPLTAIRWYSELLLKKHESFTPKQVEMLENIHTTGVQLAELIDDLLSVSKFEKGAIIPDIKSVDLVSLLEKTVSEFQLQIDTKKQLLIKDFSAEEFHETYFDEVLIKQVIVNLLSNASKYTPEGGKITLAAHMRGDSQIVISVSDTGMGISDKDKLKIFDRFFRAQNAQDEGIPGTGLGLSLVKMIIETCGGEIWFDSKEGEGTTFSFFLPLKPNL